MSNEAPVVTPPPVPPRRGLPVGAIIGIIVGAVVVVGAIIAAIVLAVNLSNAAVAAANAPKPFEVALDECGVNTGASVSILDDGEGLLIDGEGEDSVGLGTDKIACIFIALDVPDATISRMDSTRALDGRQEDELDDYTVEWTYHPDDGLDVLFTR